MDKQINGQTVSDIQHKSINFEVFATTLSTQNLVKFQHRKCGFLVETVLFEIVIFSCFFEQDKHSNSVGNKCKLMDRYGH